jgi:two-component system LytT family response regulator
MNIVIVEDEVPASSKLEQLILRYDESFKILKVLRNIEDSVDFFANIKEKIDLIFMDIQLTDGTSFEIFKQVELKTPIIFTTAYNEYAIEAFKVNSIDYLLKPVRFEQLTKAIEKLKTFPEHLGKTSESLDMSMLAKLLNKDEDYKNRFMVKIGEHIHSIKTEEIACFYSDGRIVYLLTDKKRKFIVDYKLEDLENMLDPKTFMRVQRSFIVNIDAIKDVLVYSKTRLRVLLHVDIDKEIIVSREKTKSFKDWLSG